MPTLAIISLLIGAVLGAGFRVLVLAPAVGIAVIAILGFGLARQTAPLQTGEALLVGVTGLQLGYLGGVGIRSLLLWSRIIRPSVKWNRGTRSVTEPRR